MKSRKTSSVNFRLEAEVRAVFEAIAKARGERFGVGKHDKVKARLYLHFSQGHA